MRLLMTPARTISTTSTVSAVLTRRPSLNSDLIWSRSSSPDRRSPARVHRKAESASVTTAAAVLTTRVASSEEGSSLGKDIGAQLLAQPTAIAIIPALLLLVPGSLGFRSLQSLMAEDVTSFSWLSAKLQAGK